MFKQTSVFRRGLSTAVILLVVLVLFAAAAPSTARAKTVPVRVKADAGWVATGIYLETGDVVALAAHGQAITGPLKDYPLAKSGPGGQPWNDPCGVYLPAGPCALAGAYYGILIGRMGPSGTPFVIGDAASFTAPETGELYLAVNDNTAFYGDNSGGFTVLFP